MLEYIFGHRILRTIEKKIVCIHTHTKEHLRVLITITWIEYMGEPYSDPMKPGGVNSYIKRKGQLPQHYSPSFHPVSNPVN